jgi:hypothetical protein
VSAAEAASTNNLSTISVSVWIYPRSFSNNGTFVSKHWSLNLANVTTIETESVEFYVNGNSTSLSAQAPSGSIKLNQWQHVVSVWNGSTDASQVKFYINGSLVATTEQFDLAGGASDDSATRIWIGDHSIFTEPLNGAMDDLRVYNRALTPDEVKRLYNIGR